MQLRRHFYNRARDCSITLLPRYPASVQTVGEAFRFPWDDNVVPYSKLGTSALHLSASDVFQKPIVSAGNSIAKRDCRTPAQIVPLGHIDKFAWRAVRFGRIPGQLAVKANYIAN